MGYREFVDDVGSLWRVWDVKPEPRTTPGKEIPVVNADTPDEGPRHVAPGWKQGWLAFQSDHASRRLRPIPRNWETTGEYTLRNHLKQAATVRQREG